MSAPVLLRSGALEATVAPEAAMLVTSLRHAGEELLGQRADAETFARTGKTTGSPLLYPWANRLELGAATRLELDDRMLPTGRRSPLERRALQLADGAYDEALADVDGPFVLMGEKRRIEVRFLEGAPCAHFFAPVAEALVSFEPMAAPGDALVTGDGLQWAPCRMTFSIQISA